jgi:activating signal cointegrator complex subunit 3
MIGRAGRPGFDDHGIACVMVSDEKKNFYKKFLYEPFPVESSLANHLIDHLNAEIAAGTLSNKKHCIDYLTWTYFFRRLTKNPTYYNLLSNSAEAINTYLRELVDSTLLKLRSAGCIEIDTNDEESVRPTQLGYLASFYYLSYQTISGLASAIKENTGIADLIDVLSKAEEFAGLPVRHNEEVLNEALSHLVPLKVNKHNLESPHVKANLLLQAHFDRCPLPITDFITDTKSVLDQSIRIIQGMIDISS